MPIARGWCGVYRKAWCMLSAFLVLAGWIAGAGAQSSELLGTGAGVGVSLKSEGGDTAASVGSGVDDDLLFAGGPREPGVLSEAGTLIGSGARAPGPREQGDAVSALVASAIGDEDVSEPIEESTEPEGEAREGARGLLRSLGKFLGLARDP